MGNKKDSLGDRMKRYENVSKVSLVRRMPLLFGWMARHFTRLQEGL